MEHSPPPFFKRGPAPLARLTFFALLSVSLLVADLRFKYLETIRQVAAAAIYPLQRVAAAPGEIIERFAEFFVAQSSLQSENTRLAQQHLADSRLLQQTQALQAENDYLRGLLDARARFQGSAVMGEVLYAGRDPFERKLVIDKGARAGIEVGQAAIDSVGLIGQVTRVYPFLAEITLITDKVEAVPVQILRNGLRAVVFGFGADGALDLRYMAVNADIQNGDTLVTSGIDGTYPPGIPVATVSNIERNAAYAFARITCKPLAGVDQHAHVLVVANPKKAEESVLPPPEEPSAKRKKPQKDA